MLNASVVMSKAEVELGAQQQVWRWYPGRCQGCPCCWERSPTPCRDVLGADMSCPPPVSTEQLCQPSPCCVSGCSAGCTSSRFAGARGGAGSVRLSREPTEQSRQKGSGCPAEQPRRARCPEGWTRSSAVNTPLAAETGARFLRKFQARESCPGCRAGRKGQGPAGSGTLPAPVAVCWWWGKVQGAGGSALGLGISS